MTAHVLSVPSPDPERQSVQLDQEGFEYSCDCALGRAPDLNLSNTVIGRLHKQHGGCTMLQNHRRRSTALRAWGSASV